MKHSNEPRGNSNNFSDGNMPTPQQESPEGQEIKYVYCGICGKKAEAEYTTPISSQSSEERKWTDTDMCESYEQGELAALKAKQEWPTDDEIEEGYNWIEFSTTGHEIWEAAIQWIKQWLEEKINKPI